MVVIVLAGLVSMPIVGQISRIRTKARLTECAGNIRQIATLLNVYRSEHKRYPRAALDDFRPLGGIVDELGIFTCPGTDDKIEQISDLAGGSSYRYFGSAATASSAMAKYGDGLISTSSDTVSGDSNRGHGNDEDGYDEDNPGRSRRARVEQTKAFDPSVPLKRWSPDARYGAIYDRDYAHHDGNINIYHITDGTWETVQEFQPYGDHAEP